MSLNNHLLILRASLISLLVVAVSPLSVLADESVCPDMSGHEQVLKEGQDCADTHGAPGGSAVSLDAMDFSGFPSLWVSRFPVGSTQSDVTFPDQNEYFYYYWLADGLQARGIKTYGDMESARTVAAYYSSRGLLSDAKALYEKINKALQCGSVKCKKDEAADIETEKNINDSFEFAMILRNNRKYSESIAVYEEILRGIDQPEISDIRLKLRVTSQVVDEFKPPSLLTDTSDGKQTYAQALNLSNEYRRMLQCLNMADQLDHTAGQLERQGNYDMAVKLYGESKSIKERNLGEIDPDALLQDAYVARTRFEQGKIAESKSIFENVLGKYRELSKPGESFGTFLEVYADTLNRMHEFDRANKIAAEARKFYEKNNLK